MEDGSYLEAVRTALAPRYRIEREIGHGAYANVFLATPEGSATEVAVKILKPEWMQAVARERFLREIRVTAQLHHENILALLDSGEMGGFLFFVTPYVRGETLRHRLRRERQLALEEILRLSREVGAGLSEAHLNGVVHRDIKPENILLDDGRAVVADFGIAKAFSEAGVDTITSTGLGMGTPPYMSPEQASGEHQLDQRSDVYSLACVIYEMLVGETPYTGPTAQVIVAKKLSQPVPSVRALRDTVSSQLDQVLGRALAKMPADRYATVNEFLVALGPALAAGELPAPRRLLVLPRRATLISLGIAAAAGIAALVFATRPARGWPGGRPPSVVVIPLHGAASSEPDRALSAELADAITRELNQWQSIRAVPNVSTTGPMFDLGLRGPTLASETDGIRVARQVRVHAMLAVLVRRRGDSAFAEASLIDVPRGRPARAPVLVGAGHGDLRALVAPIVRDILGLTGEAGDPTSLRKISTFPDAVVAYLDGLQSLDHGRIPRAEQDFRRAIVIDSGFAAAKHQLALSLYLESRTRSRRLATLAPEIAQLSTAAVAQSRGLARHDSLRIAAFHAFQSGNYEESRALYAAILAEDPTDVYSLLMRGVVEVSDPWLVADDSTLRPRSNPNVAIRDLNEILHLRPQYDLGYDNLSEVYRRVNDAAERAQCPGFERPRDQVRLPWEAGNVQEQSFFCPVILDDTIAWTSYEAFETIDRERVRTGARRFFEQYLALVRRWATYATNEVRPRQEMVNALLAHRRRLGVSAPERISEIADSALRFAESALALKSDTTIDDLAGIGNIYLAINDHARLQRITERIAGGLAPQGSAPRLLAANPFLATGRPARAMEIRSVQSIQRFIEDSSTGGLIPYGGAELPIARIQILGATGVAGAALQRELRDVFRLWSESRYNDRHRRALRTSASTDIASALMLEPEAMASWDRSVTITDPLWRALVLSTTDSSQSRRYLQESMEGPPGPWSEATRSYLQAIVAGRLGDHRLAIARFSRIDSLPLSTESMDTGWGFRSLSLLRRAESWEALGDTAQARNHYDAFARWWASADSLGRQLLQNAAGSSVRLGKRP